MRALTAGERRASVGVVAGLVGVLCLLVSTLALTLSYRGQLIELKETIKARCEARVEYDRRFIRAAEGDARFYADLLDIGARAEEIRVEPLTPEMRALVEEQKQIVLTAQQRKQAIVAEGVIGRCDQYALVTQR